MTESDLQKIIQTGSRTEALLATLIIDTRLAVSMLAAIAMQLKANSEGQTYTETARRPWWKRLLHWGGESK